MSSLSYPYTITISSEKGLEVISDQGLIKEVVKKIIAANEKVVNDINKNPNAIKYLVGQVMRETRGKADPKLSEAELLDQIQKIK